MAWRTWLSQRVAPTFLIKTSQAGNFPDIHELHHLSQQSGVNNMINQRYPKSESTKVSNCRSVLTADPNDDRYEFVLFVTFVTNCVGQSTPPAGELLVTRWFTVERFQMIHQAWWMMIQNVLMTDIYFMPDFEMLSFKELEILKLFKKVSCFDQYNNPLFAKYPKTWSWFT